MCFLTRSILLLLFLVTSPFAFSQKTIVLKAEKLIIPDRTFYIADVIDERPDTTSLGITSNKQKLVFEKAASSYLLDYFNIAIPQEYKKQQPITLKIKKLQLKEENQYSEIASVSVIIDFYSSVSGTPVKVYEAKSDVNESGIGIAASHDKRIRFALYDCLKQFAESEWKSRKANTGGKENTQFENPPTRTKEPTESNDIEQLKPKNIKSIGVLLGGICLIGYEYEWRVHNYIGINIGVGIIGATGGIKIHTKPHKDSHFFNISIKDLGFGLMDAASVEWGGRWVFRAGKSLGLIYQIGYAYIVNIESEFKQALYGDNKVTGGMIFGIGLSW